VRVSDQTCGQSQHYKTKMGSVGVLCSHQYLEHIQAFAYYVAKVFWGSDNVESQSGLIWTNEGEILPSPFSETTGIAVEERNAAESGRIATFPVGTGRS